MFTLLSNYSLLISTLFIYLIGLCVGSFLNVLIDRLPREVGIGGRSHCENCKKTLAVRLGPKFARFYHLALISIGLIINK